MPQTITPFLWFDDQAEEAMEFYTSVFEDSHAGDVHRLPDGVAMTVSFTLNSEKFIALNGGPAHANFNESISFFVSCESQDEVDELWSKLTADGGEESQCGWLKDKFGLSWQIVPSGMMELLGNADRDGARRATEAMMKMRKLDINEVRAAFDGTPVG